jgi:dihydrofolate synthase/folylpolyglutamate synthase
MSFVAAVDHLHALTQELAATAPRRKFDLAHMRILARALGDPQLHFPSVLIAGTNGKGSTAATLAGILAAAGYRTGLYTSPHLSRVTERIRTSAPNVLESVILSEGRDPTAVEEPACFSHLHNRSRHSANTPPNLTEIPEETFARLYFRVDETAQRLVSDAQLPHHPSFFESLTALAFLFFAESNLDIAILEVGMGGRLDATNIVEPVLSVITDIALDHQDYLGNTIAEIAREKAGILRPGGTLITLPQHPEANQAIGEVAVALDTRAINAAPYLPNRTFINSQASPSTSDLEGVILSDARSAESKDLPPRSYSHSGHRRSAPVPCLLNHYDLALDGQILCVRSPLPGEHQRRNLALAIAAAIELRNQKSYNIPSAAIAAGIANTAWPGRLEFLPPNLLLDVAHNPAGAWALRAAIATLPEQQPRTLLFSCLRDKDLTEISRILFPLFDSSGHRPLDHIVLAPIDNPRAAHIDDLLAAARALDVPAHAAATPAEALALAQRLTPPEGLIVATGSIYLIGALREQVLAQ